MSLTMDVITDRVASVLVNQGYVEAQTPFTFDLQPSGDIDGSFRLDGRSGTVKGGLRYSEERNDQLEVWVARVQTADPKACRRLLTRDVHSITTLVTRDGHEDGGDYCVNDEARSHEIRTQAGWAYAVLRLTLPVNYEAQL